MLYLDHGAVDDVHRRYHSELESCNNIYIYINYVNVLLNPSKVKY